MCCLETEVLRQTHSTPLHGYTVVPAHRQTMVSRISPGKTKAIVSFLFEKWPGFLRPRKVINQTNEPQKLHWEAISLKESNVALFHSKLALLSHQVQLAKDEEENIVVRYSMNFQRGLFTSCNLFNPNTVKQNKTNKTNKTTVWFQEVWKKKFSLKKSSQLKLISDHVRWLSK